MDDASHGRFGPRHFAGSEQRWIVPRSRYLDQARNRLDEGRGSAGEGELSAIGRAAKAATLVLFSGLAAVRAVASTLPAPGSSGGAAMVDSLRSSTSPTARDRIEVDAPPVNSASPDLVDRADFPARAGIAWDRCLRHQVNRQAVTLDLTPLGIVRLLRGEELGPATDPPGLLGRAVARVTIGGPPQFVDSLRVAGAQHPTNHVTSELKLLLRDGVSDDGGAHGLAFALALTADNLGTGYGLDRYGGTLIAEREGPRVWTAAAGYRILERYRTSERMAETKLGMATAWRWFARASRRGGVDIDLAGACLLRNHERPPVWQGDLRLDLPLRDGLRLSVAERRSDRPEVRGDPRKRGVISVAYDL